MRLPEYHPPSDQRACIAVGLGPLFVLIAFTGIVTRLIDVDIGFAALLACTVWVIYEMHDHQKAVDRYDHEYVESHLCWRSPDILQRLVSAEDAHPPTRDFVLRFLDADRALLRNGPLA